MLTWHFCHVQVNSAKGAVREEYHKIGDPHDDPSFVSKRQSADGGFARSSSEDLKSSGKRLEITSTFGDESISIFESNAPKVSWMVYVAIAIQGYSTKRSFNVISISILYTDCCRMEYYQASFLLRRMLSLAALTE